MLRRKEKPNCSQNPHNNVVILQHNKLSFPTALEQRRHLQQPGEPLQHWRWCFIGTLGGQSLAWSGRRPVVKDVCCFVFVCVFLVCGVLCCFGLCCFLIWVFKVFCCVFVFVLRMCFFHRFFVVFWVCWRPEF